MCQKAVAVPRHFLILKIPTKVPNKEKMFPTWGM
jgi:hypothetical protein